MSGSGGSISSSSSEGRQGGEPSRDSSRRSLRMKSAEVTLGDAPEEEEESWSSDYSASDEEEDQETFSESTEVVIKLQRYVIKECVEFKRLQN